MRDFTLNVGVCHCWVPCEFVSTGVYAPMFSVRNIHEYFRYAHNEPWLNLRTAAGTMQPCTP
jgi:hypothetical protein